ncbi:MAG: ABC transporter ATP-binding protein [Candidatus Omnitrophica bacterium]|nr:ABC transporter ATP-binding protein [Candidatus Omnitrophota bacterium]
MIVSKNLSKQFGEFEALKNVSFEIEQGEIVGFLGQNGAGKTTLMRILTAYLPSSSGQAFVGGEDVSLNPLAVHKKIGYLPETPPLYPNMTVKAYLRFAAQLKDVGVKFQKAQVEHVLEECRLEDVQNQVIGTLSRGYKQRVGIAQAIVHEPEVIILDEPTNGLDPIQILHVRELIRKLEHKRTVIVSTHILSEIEQLAKRVLIIKKGEIVVDSNLEKFLIPDDRKQIFVKVKGEEFHIEQAVKDTNSVKQINIEFLGEDIYELHLENTNNVAHYGELVQNFIKYGIKVIEIKEKKGTLEEAFLKINK